MTGSSPARPTTIRRLMKYLFKIALKRKPCTAGLKSATRTQVRALKRALFSAGISFKHITHVRGVKLPYNGVIHINYGRYYDSKNGKA